MLPSTHQDRELAQGYGREHGQSAPPPSHLEAQSALMPTIHPSAPTPDSRPPIVRSASGTSTVYSHSPSTLPPPHALPSDSQPIMLQLNSVPDISYNSMPGSPPLPPRRGSPAIAQGTLPPAPAHPALALMRSNSARSAPRRPLSAPRVPSAMRASTLPDNTSYAPGSGNDRNIAHGAQRTSYASAVSTTSEKDRALFDVHAPTSPSGRALRLDLPELEHQYAAPRGAASRVGNDFGIEQRAARDAMDPRCLDGRYRDSGMRTPITMPGGYGNTYRYDAQDRGREQALGYNHGMTGGGGGEGPGGPGMTSNNMYFDAYNEISIPRLPRTVNDRLAPTFETVKQELAKSSKKAQVTGYAVNAAIGLQVFISALITALSAVTSGRRTQIMTSILGGAGTVVASYLARARGSNEPELSIARVKDLQRFERAVRAFLEDCGKETGWEGFPGYVPPSSSNRANGNEYGVDETSGEGDEESEKRMEKGGAVGNIPREWDGGARARELDDRIRRLRAELEHLLGNGNGERKLSQV